MMSLLKTIRYILRHPLARKSKIAALSRFFRYQLVTRILPYPIVYPFTSRTKLIVERGMTGATGNIYCGLHEFEDMGFLLHYLRSDDLFVDVGANVGSYTVLASGHIGCSTVSFEPVPVTYEKLLANIRINNIEHIVKTQNVGVGSASGKLNFTVGLDTMNHVVLSHENGPFVEVEIVSLDQALEDLEPILMKIDVEGYEMMVLEGAFNVLKSKRLNVLIIESNASIMKYDLNKKNVSDELLLHGFLPYTYNPFTRSIQPYSERHSQNIIFIKNIDFALQRVLNGMPFQFGNLVI